MINAKLGKISIDEDIESIISSVDFSSLKNKKLLITGASGLLGVYFVSCVKRLQEELNVTLYIWINNELEPYIEPLFDFPCNIIRGDITDPENFKELPIFDFIIHAAGYGQPTKFVENKLGTIKINTSATLNLFSKLIPGGNFLFLSSSEVYNGSDKQYITENEIGTTNTDNPRSCYIESKRCGEAICHTYSELGYNVKIVRLSLTYGPGTKKYDGRVINSLIQKGICNEFIELLDSGSAVRTYCYISDAIEMMWNIFLFGKESIYNVGGIETSSIKEVALTIGEKMKKDVFFQKSGQGITGNPNLVELSINRYQLEFNKHTFVPLSVGLSNTIDWQKYIYEEF